ncbi:hypothetical protein A1QO_02440 [Vibrio genomosp. F10 str. ZF-129]|uniref:Tyr recombinase domain-containing protein n=1 Tax=Vibrio genomosp. F10 str. ZF-129 TaxID=1187848 RepID=A0A1E5BKH5_9VIBR|nr:hypothetical protein [Vibrio genomosp. F10]OEE38255.1 hypothetical protein A1QO_02440 [Vibrio genomosp. F10 str. ZF-129]
MTDELEFKWVLNPPKKTVKQPDIISPNDFDSLVSRINNAGVDPLVAARNQSILWQTYGSAFRAIECSKWLIREALYPSGEIMKLTRIRSDATKGNYPIIAPVVIDKQRAYLDQWLQLRVKHRIGLNQTGKKVDLYRGLNPDSPVFLSYRHQEWQPFSLTRKVTKSREYFVATAMQNAISRLYKDYGHPNCSSHTGRHSISRLMAKVLEGKTTDVELRKVIQNLLHHRDERSQDDYREINWKSLREKTKNMFK